MVRFSLQKHINIANFNRKNIYQTFSMMCHDVLAFDAATHSHREISIELRAKDLRHNPNPRQSEFNQSFLFGELLLFIHKYTLYMYALVFSSFNLISGINARNYLLKIRLLSVSGI